MSSLLALLLTAASAQVPVEVVQLATGGHSVCALDASGVPWCWGLTVWDGNRAHRDQLTPRVVSPLPTERVAVSDTSRCLIQSGRVTCSGSAMGTKSKLMTDFEDVVDVVVDAGGGCLLRKRGAVWCWNASGERVARIFGGERTLAMLRRQAPDGYACTLTGGKVDCVGDNHVGQLGVAAAVAQVKPVHVPALEQHFPREAPVGVPPWAVEFSVIDVQYGVQEGQEFSCILDRRPHAVACTGARFSDRPIDLLTGRAQFSTMSQYAVLNELAGAVALSGRGAQLCALFQREVRCSWGGYVQPFMGWPADNLPPEREWSFRSEKGLVDLAAGENHLCVLTVDGQVLCAGDNRWGQLGTPGGPQLEALKPVSLPFVTRLWAGEHATCAMTDHGVWCWGLISEWAEIR